MIETIRALDPFKLHVLRRCITGADVSPWPNIVAELKDRQLIDAEGIPTVSALTAWLVYLREIDHPIAALREGDQVDYWSYSEASIKSATVADLTKSEVIVWRDNHLDWINWCDILAPF